MYLGSTVRRLAAIAIAASCQPPSAPSTATALPDTPDSAPPVSTTALPDPETPAPPRVQIATSGTSASLRGVSMPAVDVAWASGSAGTVLRSLDGGQSWSVIPVAGAEALELRDIQAFDADTVLVLSAGSPGRVHGTTDGGKHWTIHLDDARPDVFLDCMAFWDRRRGVIMGDPIDGRFTVLTTDDGGITWHAPASPPAADEGEAAFAASGTCIATADDGRAWFGGGGGRHRRTARVFGSTDYGQTWTAAETPMASGQAQGLFSLTFVDRQRGIAVGGDYQKVDDAIDNVALTTDGGQTWVRPTGRLSGFREIVAQRPDTDPVELWAVGPSGADRSLDGGATWHRVELVAGLHALAFAPDGSRAVAVGGGGAIAVLIFS